MTDGWANTFWLAAHGALPCVLKDDTQESRKSYMRAR